MLFLLFKDKQYQDLIFAYYIVCGVLEEKILCPWAPCEEPDDRMYALLRSMLEAKTISSFFVIFSIR